MGDMVDRARRRADERCDRAYEKGVMLVRCTPRGARSQSVKVVFLQRVANGAERKVQRLGALQVSDRTSSHTRRQVGESIPKELSEVLEPYIALTIKVSSPCANSAMILTASGPICSPRARVTSLQKRPSELRTSSRRATSPPTNTPRVRC